MRAVVETKPKGNHAQPPKHGLITAPLHRRTLLVTSEGHYRPYSGLKGIEAKVELIMGLSGEHGPPNY